MNNIIETTLVINQNLLGIKASALLSMHAQLPQSKIKDAMQKGAVWLHRGEVKQRLRRASKTLKLGDKLELNYNAELLNQNVPKPSLIHDAQDYSVWYKPYGLNCQGSRWGDFASINRWVERQSSLIFGEDRSVLLVHRLDRATTGLILLCHTKSAARAFSEMFKQRLIDKRYQAIVKGDFSIFPKAYEVDEPIDQKHSISQFSFVEKKEDCSLLDIILLTGRKHQIRKHLSGIGYPIVGDRLYGKASEKDLQLQSLSLSFECPIRHQQHFFIVSNKDRLKL